MAANDPGPYNWHGLNLIPARITNYVHYNLYIWGMNEYFHPTLNWACAYFSMLRIKLNRAMKYLCPGSQNISLYVSHYSLGCGRIWSKKYTNYASPASFILLGDLMSLIRTIDTFCVSEQVTWSVEIKEMVLLNNIVLVVVIAEARKQYYWREAIHPQCIWFCDWHIHENFMKQQILPHLHFAGVHMISILQKSSLCL